MDKTDAFCIFVRAGSHTSHLPIKESKKPDEENVNQHEWKPKRGQEKKEGKLVMGQRATADEHIAEEMAELETATET